MRMIFPTVTENGFGNNVMTLAKAHLIAESCHLTYQPPVWPYCMHVKPASPNGYGYYFPSTPADKIKLTALSYLFGINRKLKMNLPVPTITYRDTDYERSGIADVGEACLAFLKEKGLDAPSASLALTVGGMWGGYIAIQRARGWITDLLLSHDDTRRRFEALRDRLAGKPRVAINIRMNDFVTREVAGAIVPGERVVQLPLKWYITVCQQIREHLDCHFVLVSDGKSEELKPFLDTIQPTHILGEPYQDLLGILLLNESDLIVASNSTYSRLGAFLNDKPYVWPADTLYPDTSGKFGYLWKDLGHAPTVLGTPDAVRRCFALPVEFHKLPAGLVRYLESGCRLPLEDRLDLMYRDAVPLLTETAFA